MNATALPFKIQNCPYANGIVGNDDLKCKCSQTTQWDCPAGSFCKSPSKQFKCPLGFYCPVNTYEPIYCCAGYYCPDSKTMLPCPKNMYCQMGTIEPMKCTFGFCQERSERVDKYMIAFVFAGFLLLVKLCFLVGAIIRKKRYERFKRHAERVVKSGAGEEATILHMGAGVEKKRKTKTFNIEFDNIGVRLANGTTLLSGISGSLLCGRTAAIMGPSGSGKTTFINALTGKIAKTAGKITINGKQGSLEKYRKLIGFVPQEDIMIRELNVHDILSHSARLRLPSHWGWHRVIDKVIHTIDYLGLTHVMYNKIGDEESRGLSGGQRKRVNIGIELVAEPSILLCDEPTSGLDSSSSLDLCKLLARIAHEKQLTVAAIIHSPSPAAFKQFDDLILLGKGGKLIYQGPRADALGYFQQIGFYLPEDQAPSDYFMDIASGMAARKGSEYYDSDDLSKLWKLHKQGKLAEGLDSFSEESISSEPFLVMSILHDAIDYIKDVLREVRDTIAAIWRKTTCQKDPVRESAGIFISYWLCLRRAFSQYLRSPGAFLTQQVLHIGCGIFISLASQSSFYLGSLPEDLCATAPIAMQGDCRAPQRDTLRQVGQFVAWGIGFAGIAVGSGTFGNERVVHWRERASGLSTLPYFLAKVTADLLRIVLAAGCFMFALVLSFNNNQEFWALYVTILSLYFFAFSSGYFISSIVQRQQAALVGVVFALLWAVAFSGVEPTVKSARDENSLAHYLLTMSAPRWAISAFYLKETEARKYQNLHVSLEAYGYDRDDYLTDIRNVFIIAIGWQVLAFLCMKLLHRDMQK